MWNRHYHRSFIDEEIWVATLRKLFKVCHPLSSRTSIQTHVSTAPEYSLKIWIWIFHLFFHIAMLSSLRNKKHCPGPFVNKEVPTSDSSRAQCQMNWSWILMGAMAMRGFPIPDWLNLLCPLSIASFPSSTLSIYVMIFSGHSSISLAYYLLAIIQFRIPLKSRVRSYTLGLKSLNSSRLPRLKY